jgi:hypothetical protein
MIRTIMVLLNLRSSLYAYTQFNNKVIKILKRFNIKKTIKVNRVLVIEIMLITTLREKPSQIKEIMQSN